MKSVQKYLLSCVMFCLQSMNKQKKKKKKKKKRKKQNQKNLNICPTQNTSMKTLIKYLKSIHYLFI